MIYIPRLVPILHFTILTSVKFLITFMNSWNLRLNLSKKKFSSTPRNHTGFCHHWHHHSPVFSRMTALKFFFIHFFYCSCLLYHSKSWWVSFHIDIKVTIFPLKLKVFIYKIRGCQTGSLNFLLALTPNDSNKYIRMLIVLFLVV